MGGWMVAHLDKSQLFHILAWRAGGAQHEASQMIPAKHRAGCEDQVHGWCILGGDIQAVQTYIRLIYYNPFSAVLCETIIVVLRGSSQLLLCNYLRCFDRTSNVCNQCKSTNQSYLSVPTSSPLPGIFKPCMNSRQLQRLGFTSKSHQPSIVKSRPINR